jgi:hypothetical protein
MDGLVDTHYFGQVAVKTKETRSAGDVGNLYMDGATANIAAFHQSITKGDYSNPTVAESVRSNLTTILGRTAAYREELVTWDQMMKKREKWVADRLQTVRVLTPVNDIHALANYRHSQTNRIGADWLP